MYIYIYIYTHTHTHSYIHTYTHTHTHTHTHTNTHGCGAFFVPNKCIIYTNIFTIAHQRSIFSSSLHAAPRWHSLYTAAATARDRSPHGHVTQ